MVSLVGANSFPKKLDLSSTLHNIQTSFNLRRYSGFFSEYDGIRTSAISIMEPLSVTPSIFGRLGATAKVFS